MKRRWMAIPVAALILGGVLYSGYVRAHITDYLAQENWKDCFTVALLSEDMGLEMVENMRELLPNAPYILRVQVLGGLERNNGDSQQKVKVCQVYAGEGLEVGQEIYIFRDGWSVSYVGKPSLERGYVNIMQVGREYLVFLNGQVDALDPRVPVYITCGDVPTPDGDWKMIAAPVFCYDRMENKVVEATGEWGTGVLYSRVSENEFFGESQAVVEAWEQLKAEMLQKYPR